MMSIERAQHELDRRRQSVQTRYKPGYHLSVPAGWLNDPNGFGYFEGRAHLFYQFHPYDSVWGPMHWGHWISQDLVHWQEAPVALAPDQAYDSYGCFSGTSVEADGKLMLMYTGVQPTGEEGKYYQQQCIAESCDGLHFAKRAQNPVIDRTLLPAGASVYEFRDPKLSRTADGYRVILASQGPNGGQLLAYTSPDLNRWTYAGVYADGLADMSECPDVFELDGRTVLVVCEIGADAGAYGSPQVTLYAAGREKNGRFQAEGPLRLVDCGLDFYAPQTMQTPDGRRVLIGWALSWSHVMPTHTLGHGWAGMMTLPRECTLDSNGMLCQKPIRELASLRTREERLESVAVNGRVSLPQLAGRQREFELCIDLGDAPGLTLRLMETQDEHFAITYDRRTQLLRVDRSLCGYPLTPSLQPEPRPWCEAKVPLQNNRLMLHVFVDASIVEIYADEGRVAMSSLAFPRGEAYGASIEAAGASIEKGLSWMMESK